MRKIIPCLFIVSVLCSCASKVPFTASLKSSYGISDKTLRRIQFYTSKEIILIQSDDKSFMQTVEGKILISDIVHEKRIVIPKGTPCTIDKVLDSLRVIVSFEYGDNRILIFGLNAKGTYSLFAKNWVGKDGKVDYNSNTYFTQNNSGMTILNVKLKRLSYYRRLERKVEGKRI